MKGRTMTIGEIVAKFRTKEHFIEACRQRGKFVPQELFLSWSFVKGILTGEKKLLSLSQVRDVAIPPRLT